MEGASDKKKTTLLFQRLERSIFGESLEKVALWRKKEHTPPKLNTDPEKWWLEDESFLLGFGNFSGENSLLNFGGISLIFQESHQLQI